MSECAMILANVWDARGAFVCGKPAGHDGRHESRPSKARPVVTWEAEQETGREAKPSASIAGEQLQQENAPGTEPETSQGPSA